MRRSKEVSQREITCLKWAAMGKTSWEMAQILGLSEGCINYHIQRACLKLGVIGRQAAITQMMQKGMTLPPEGYEETFTPATNSEA